MEIRPLFGFVRTEKVTAQVVPTLPWPLAVNNFALTLLCVLRFVPT